MEKNNKFKQLANARVNKAINTIRLIGNLSNKSIYSYTDTQAKLIINALENEIKVIKNKFTDTKNNRDRREFELE